MRNADEPVGGDHKAFSTREMDKIIRQIVDRVRSNYYQNGESARGIPAEVKRIVETGLERV